MTWQREIIIKLLKLVELIGMVLLFIIKIIKAILKKAFIPVVISILILGFIYFGVNMINLPF